VNVPVPNPIHSSRAIGAVPGSLRVARVLLIGQAGLVFSDTWNAVLVAAGLQGGSGPSTLARILIVGLIGGGFATLGVVCFVEMRKPSKPIWWASLGVLPLAALHIGSLIALFPEKAINAYMVIDVYLVSGLMTLLIVGALLSRTARRYLWSA